MILRPCLCLPTFNNPDTLAQVVQDALSEVPYPVLIVDDGSVPKVIPERWSARDAPPLA